MSNLADIIYFVNKYYRYDSIREKEELIEELYNLLEEICSDNEHGLGDLFLIYKLYNPTLGAYVFFELLKNAGYKYDNSKCNLYKQEAERIQYIHKPRYAIEPQHPILQLLVKANASIYQILYFLHIYDNYCSNLIENEITRYVLKYIDRPADPTSIIAMYSSYNSGVIYKHIRTQLDNIFNNVNIEIPDKSYTKPLIFSKYHKLYLLIDNELDTANICEYINMLEKEGKAPLLYRLMSILDENILHKILWHIIRKRPTKYNGYGDAVEYEVASNSQYLQLILALLEEYRNIDIVKIVNTYPQCILGDYEDLRPLFHHILKNIHLYIKEK